MCLKGLCNTSNTMRVEEIVILIATFVIGFFKRENGQVLGFPSPALGKTSYCSRRTARTLTQNSLQVSLEKQANSDS